MTTRADARRAGTARWLVYVTALAALAAVGAVWRDARAGRVQTVSGPVFPAFLEAPLGETVVMVTTADDSFHVTLDPDGRGASVPERGGYPVSAERVASVYRALGEMSYRARKTADPERYDRLGLGDPYQGGLGTRLEVTTLFGDRLASVILGDARPTGGRYARLPGRDQTFVVDLDMPPIDRPSDWLTLDFLPIAREDVARVELRLDPDASYALERADAGARDFTLVEPADGWRLMTQGAGNTIAWATARLRFDDVRPAAALIDPAPKRHIVTTFDGVRLELAAHVETEGVWVIMTAQASPDADDTATADVAALNARVEGWGYRLPPFAAERLTRPFAEIAEPIVEADVE